MPDREYVEVQGKKYPLKTEAERAASKARSTTPKPDASSKTSNSGSGASVSIPNPENEARQVLLALTVAAIVFAAAGGQVEKVIGKARGLDSTNTGKPFTAQTVMAWAFLFVGLMVMADFSPTKKLSVAFAYLILLSVLLEFGPQAFNNIGSLFNSKSFTETSTVMKPPSNVRGGFKEGL